MTRKRAGICSAPSTTAISATGRGRSSGAGRSRAWIVVPVSPTRRVGSHTSSSGCLPVEVTSTFTSIGPGVRLAASRPVRPP